MDGMNRLPSDLKDFHADGFRLMSEETAATLLLCLVAVLMILDGLGAFAQ